MIVKIVKDKALPSYGKLFEVYGFYWLREKLYFILWPNKDEGLIIYSQNEVEIEDPVVGENMVLRKSYSNSQSIFLSQEIIDNGLYDRLVK